LKSGSTAIATTSACAPWRCWKTRAVTLKVTKLVEYFQDHRYMDQAYGFGLRWVAGSKD
jgi:uncharacterized protein involved in tellurium resistance